METQPLLFDAQLHPEGLTDQDLESMRLFGVTAALVPAHHFAPATARGLMAHFDDIVERQLPRLEKAGIRAYAALGVHPRCLPRRGLPEVLAKLPSYFQGGKVVAVGGIGLHEATAEEEESFSEQVALARRLKLPVVVQTPSRDKERVTRRTLSLLRDSGIKPPRVLVDRATGRTVRLIVECGHYAGLTLHPDELSAERAAALIRKLGPERLVLDTHSGDGAGDILAMARLARLLAKGKISAHVVARVCLRNGLGFFRLAGAEP
jgi:predicted metal-dependent TIM-barrel fold hydrolase